MITVVIPTVDGREESYQQAVKSFEDCEIITTVNAATCGEAWVEGAHKAGGDYICFAADDHEAHPGWMNPMMEAVENSTHPASVVLEPDGSLQSCGGAGWDCCKLNCSDWAAVDWSPTPFFHRDQWEWLEPHAHVLADLHYCSDVLVSKLLRHHGVQSVVRTPAVITHHNHQAGRGAGMDQHQRAARDRAVCVDYLASL